MEHSALDDGPDGTLARSLAAAQRANSAPTTLNAALRVSLGTRPANCPDHGAFEQTGYTLRAGKPIWSTCPACEQRAEAVKAEEGAARTRQRSIERREELLSQAAIPPRFRTRTFDNFVAETPDQRRAAAIARDFAEQFQKMAAAGRGLIFSGLPGTGKTHLAAAIVGHLVETPRIVCRYITCMAMIRAMRESWRKDSERSERRVLREFGVDIDLLVLDEVGVQYGTDGELTVLFEILDRRYSEMRPTIFLTNQNLEKFKAFVGDRIYDRLTETCRWVHFDWDSYRPTARREQRP